LYPEHDRSDAAPPHDARAMVVLSGSIVHSPHTMIPFSVLDLCPIVEGSNAAQAFRNSLDLARHAEAWGYKRYWVAEHHSIPGVASAATSVVIAHIGAGTRTMRIGAGGIMLPNHAPLVIAEQFGTLESLYPGRIDLALGRAPGSDRATSQALRRHPAAGDEFPQDVAELLHWFAPEQADQGVVSVPGAGLRIPIWILGSSTWGAQFAAVNGLPYAFASHFAPQLMMQALALYRSRFEPSEWLDKPYAMLGMNVVAADSDSEARLLHSSRQQSTLAIRFGRRGLLPPPVAELESRLSPVERSVLEEAMPGTVVGSPATVRKGLAAFISKTGADELIIAAQIYDHQARLRSYELTAQVRASMAGDEAASAEARAG
jgi:luciferase family oxidoreductase group 1